MREINKVIDLAPYAGNVVSFESASWFSRPDRCFSIEKKMFAYIGKNLQQYQGGEKGFSFYIVYNKENTPASIGLTKSELKDMHLKVSLATDDEINLIKEALVDKQVKFGYGSIPEVISIVDNQGIVRDLTSYCCRS